MHDKFLLYTGSPLNFRYAQPKKTLCIFSEISAGRKNKMPIKRKRLVYRVKKQRKITFL